MAEYAGHWAQVHQQVILFLTVPVRQAAGSVLPLDERSRTVIRETLVAHDFIQLSSKLRAPHPSRQRLWTELQSWRARSHGRPSIALLAVLGVQSAGINCLARPLSWTWSGGTDLVCALHVVKAVCAAAIWSLIWRGAHWTRPDRGAHVVNQLCQVRLSARVAIGSRSHAFALSTRLLAAAEWFLPNRLRHASTGFLTGISVAPLTHFRMHNGPSRSLCSAWGLYSAVAFLASSSWTHFCMCFFGADLPYTPVNVSLLQRPPFSVSRLWRPSCPPKAFLLPPFVLFCSSSAGGAARGAFNCVDEATCRAWHRGPVGSLLRVWAAGGALFSARLHPRTRLCALH